MNISHYLIFAGLLGAMYLIYITFPEITQIDVWRSRHA